LPDSFDARPAEDKPPDGILLSLKQNRKFDMYDAGIAIPAETRRKEGLWYCWDFRQLRVQLTDYTITPLDDNDDFRLPWESCPLKGKISWLLEGSLDGVRWTELHLRPAAELTNALRFAVSAPMECRFIRLTRSPHARRLPNWDLDLRSEEELRYLKSGRPDTHEDTYFDCQRFQRQRDIGSASRFFRRIRVEFFGRLSE
jgi:hypothetical protein